MIKNYTLTLDEEIVREAKKYLVVGQKLSPIVNNLLKEWVERKRREVKSNG